jgi:hypothetical protein
MLAARWLAEARALTGSTRLSVALLVLANSLPLAGVLFWHWDVGLILIAYWLENGIVGMIAVLKILLALRSPVPAATGLSVGVGYAAAIIFPFHFGFIWLIHGVFVFFLARLATPGGFGMFGGFGPFDVVGNVARDQAVPLIAGALLVSHATSFFVNYVGRQEYLRTTPVSQAIQPYARVVVLQATVVLGAFAVVLIGQPVALVALLVIFKTILDLALHLREHRQYPRPTSPLLA